MMVEHIAALAVIGCCCVTVATVSAAHHELVLPAREEAYAAQAALNAIRITNANPTGGMQVKTPLAFDKYAATVVGDKIEVKKVGTDKKWTFTRRLHTH
ncbi:hypothetical protein [Lacticaseibacillus sharpeae]|uniref:Uncharacterized protein n=1 Tax=Lacticaseibacillus sharpeae JCM 1186 = DSM 20505 TaxID=1291052 RepID=A0A0R1ZRX7_9LACO|nr:hypothetical protein [Lacticaseibacillus sharpeae]KRM54747.1 hypothetical protein FC18_GL002161 [Lacticaseibacillus sharpeae JCM 1186 = DSM 20505]